MSKKIYLAGPDVFRENAKEHFNTLKNISKKYQMEALSPFDNESGVISSLGIFSANISLINQCDVVIANLQPFRGVGVDDGTAFEIGYAFAKSKIIYGYTPFWNVAYKELALNNKIYLDENFVVLEDFSQPCNLMLVEAIIENKGKIFPDFEACICDLAHNQ